MEIRFITIDKKRIIRVIGALVIRIEQRIHLYASYVMTLFFFEIIFLMLSLLVLFGKIAAILIGFSLAILLSILIIKIYYRRNNSRVIQLIIMDLHAAFATAFLFSQLWLGTELNFIGIATCIIRSILLLVELPLIYLLTSQKIAAQFH